MEMSEPSTELGNVSRNTGGPDRTRRGRGALLRWFLILFLIFGTLGVYSVLQRRSEHQVLAQQTERMTVPHVGVIHATPINGSSAMVLPRTLTAHVASPRSAEHTSELQSRQ